MVVALVVLAAIGVMAYKLQHEFKMPSVSVHWLAVPNPVVSLCRFLRE